MNHGTKARVCTVPAIEAADGHFRAVGQAGRERTVKTEKQKKRQKGHSGVCSRYVDAVSERRFHWLAIATVHVCCWE